MLNFVHILEEFKADVDQQQHFKVEAELLAAKEDKKKADDRLAEMKSRAAEVAKTNSTFSK